MISSWKLLLIFIFLALSLQSCARLPKDFETISLDKKIGLSEVLESPQKYEGVNVLWGGKIVNCINKKELTFLEIMKFPLDADGKPKVDTFSEGRFQVETPSFLDCFIYSPGKLVTIAGVVKGLREGQIGEREYKFPLIEGKIFHLWKEEIKIQVDMPFYYRCYWWYPYCCSWSLYPCW